MLDRHNKQNDIRTSVRTEWVCVLGICPVHIQARAPT